MAHLKVLVGPGQSNNTGPRPTSEYTANQISEKTKAFTFDSGVLQNFKAGSNNRSKAIASQTAGFHTELMTQIEDNYDGNVILLKTDMIGCGISLVTGINGALNSQQPENQWYVNQYSQLLFKIANFELFFAKNLAPLGHTYEYAALIVNHGENPAGILDFANAYEVDYGLTLTGIKAALNGGAGVPNLPLYDFLISDLVVNVAAHKAIINASKQNLRAVHGNGGNLFSTNAADGYSLADDVHWDAATYTLAGQRLYTALITNGHL